MHANSIPLRRRRTGAASSPGLAGAALALVALLAAPGAGAAYNVSIVASGVSSGGAWVGNTWTASSSGARVVASEIASHLASGATVISTGSSGAENGDIAVNGTVGWSANVLTLRAARNIHFNAVTEGSGSAGLALEYGQGTAGTYNVRAPVNLAATGSFSTKDGGNPAVGYTIITTVGAFDSFTGTDLQGIRNNLGGNYVMGADIDASATIQWNPDPFRPTDYYGFKPLGADPYRNSYQNHTPFSGQFDGLGHTITGLYINNVPSPETVAAGGMVLPRNVGLFGYTEWSSDIRNVGIAGSFVRATHAYSVGVLIGENNGNIRNCFSAGSVRGSFALDNQNTPYPIRVGGLVGLKSNGHLADSYSTAEVMSDIVGGGLVGESNGLITNSFSSGLVQVTQTAGQESYAGGLMGVLTAPFLGQQVFDSYWNVETSGMAVAGGGIPPIGATGLTTAQMRQLASFANWDIAAAGGSGATWRIYEGHTYPLLTAFMTPLAVTADNVGKTYDGAAYSSALINVSYSPAGPNMARVFNTADPYNSAVDAGSYLPDLYSDQLGYDIRHVNGTLTVNPALLTVTGSFTVADKTFDGTTAAALTGQSLSFSGLIGSDTATANWDAAFADKNAGAGKTVNLSATTFSGPQGGNYKVDLSGAPTATGNISPAPITVAPGTATKFYDGATSGMGTAAVTVGSLFSPDFLAGGSFTFADKNAGFDKTVSVSGVIVVDGNNFSNVSNNYTISYASSTVGRIHPAPITVSTGDVTKTYDGTTSANGTAVVTEGTLFGSDSILGGSYAFADKHVGTGKTVTVSSVAIDDGNGGNNYNVSYADNTASTIDPAALVVTTASVIKTYDGTTHAAGTAVAASGTLYGGDSLSGGTFTFATRNADPAYTNVSVSNVTVNDGNGGGNYVVSYVDNITSRIDPAPLTVTAADVTKTYDGTTDATGTAVLQSGTLYGTDQLSGGFFSFTDKNAGVNKAVTVHGVGISDANNVPGGANYAITYVDNATSTILKAPVTVTGSFTAADKTYDGTTAATIAGQNLTFSGLIGSDSATANWAAAFADENAGAGKTGSLTATTFSGPSGGNYTVDLDTAPTATATITPAPLAVTANDAVKTYDGLAFAGGNGVAYSGFVNGENETVLGGALVYGGTAQGAVGVGDYVLTPGGLSSSNYAITYHDGTLTILPRLSHSGPTATGTGTATATVSGGGAGCGFTAAQFVAAVDPPAGVSFPHGLFDFTLGGCTPGSAVTLNIAYPGSLPAGMRYWKYGPTPDDASPHWYTIPATLAGGTATFSLVDGRLGDDDLTANGTIVDQGGPGATAAAAIPTLDDWALLALAGLIGLAGITTVRRYTVL